MVLHRPSGEHLDLVGDGRDRRVEHVDKVAAEDPAGKVQRVARQWHAATAGATQRATGVDEQLTALLDELAGEGRGLLMASHDIEQARSWDLVLCLNRVQVAFGVPESTLTMEVVERTYGAAIIALPDRPDRGILPPHHHDHRG